MSQKTNINHNTLLLPLALVVAAVAVFFPVQSVIANSYDQQINELKAQNQQANAADAALELEEHTLQAKVDRLRRDITSTQNEITANTAKAAQLEQQIVETQKKLADQHKALGETLVNMYLDSSVTPIEMIASSKSISDFIDKQEYREVARAQLQSGIQAVKKLEQELAAQEKSVKQTLADQKVMRERLTANQTEQNTLLALNQNQQAAYEGQLQQNNAKIAALRKQQAAENARLSGGRVIASIPDTSGYPWANVPFPNYTSDPWGMYYRQCVSYTAWKVWKSGRHMPFWGGIGNANQWDDNARRAGIPVDDNPKAGDVAVWPIGQYGHVMYVESVASDGSLYVSDYNQQFDGTYREYWISASSAASKNLVFIHF